MVNAFQKILHYKFGGYIENADGLEYAHSLRLFSILNLFGTALSTAKAQKVCTLISETRNHFKIEPEWMSTSTMMMV